MSSLALVLLVPSLHVPITGWDPPTSQNFAVDNSAVPHPYINPPGDSSNDLVGANDVLDIVDRACIIWGRTADVDRRCVATILGNVAEDPDFVQNGISEFHLDVTNGQPGTAGLTDCDFIWPAQATECNIWLQASSPVWQTYADNVGKNQCRLGFGCQSGIAFTNPPNRFGSVGANFFQNTVIHELGHALGLFHPICDPTTYDCPIMNQSAERVSYWPTIDETQAMRTRYGTTARIVEWSTWNINAASLFVSVNWTQLGTLLTRTPPRISCRAFAGQSGSSCAATTATWSDDLTLTQSRISFLGVTNAGVSVNSTVTLAPDAFAEGPIDIAVGNSGSRYMGVGKTPVFRTSSDATRVMLYSGVLGSAPTVTRLVDLLGTHTEPRIAYDENRNVFVAAWPKTNGGIRVISVSSTGTVLSLKNIDRLSNVPVEIACDAHLRATSNQCTIYIQDVQNGLQGRILQAVITLNADGTINDPDGDAIVGEPQNQTFWDGALLDDVATYGANAAGSQPQQNLWLVDTDQFNVVAPIVDATVFQDAALLSIHSDNQSTMGGFQTNTTSWDWGEGIARFVAVRTGAHN